MKQKIGYWSVVILCLIGIYQILSFSFVLAKRVDAIFDSSAKYDLRHEEYKKNSQMAYGYGRMWGEVTAKSYELDSYDGFLYKKNLSVQEYRIVAEKILLSRAEDFYCFGADDCMELPDDKELKRLYSVDFMSSEMPIYAFRSGFIDSFVEYIRR